MLCESYTVTANTLAHTLPLSKCLGTLFVQTTLQFSVICTSYLLETASSLVVVRSFCQICYLFFYEELYFFFLKFGFSWYR